MTTSSACRRRHALTLLAAAGLAGCASFGGVPLRVNVVDLEMLPAGGFELRVLVRLRVQNPDSKALEFQGISLELDLQGMNFASGVSAAAGTVPAFGEQVLEVPVTISAISLLRQVLSLAGESQGPRIRIGYAARGRLGGSFGGERFESKGDVEWPPRPAPKPAAPAPAPAPAVPMP